MAVRRSFLKNTAILFGATLLAKPVETLAFSKKISLNLINRNNKLFVFHTNDIGGSLGGNINMGGLNEIKGFINRTQSSGLVLDAGNFLNQKNLKIDNLRVIDLMNDAGYHVANLGNNELLLGADKLGDLVPYMNFDLINCNYELKDSFLAKSIKPYIVLTSGDIKIGIIGIGDNLNLEEVKFNNPYEKANKFAKILKTSLNCDIIICLSNLGLDKNKEFNSVGLATQSTNIDYIISGGSNDVITGAKVVKNTIKNDVIISQAGASANYLGKSCFNFNDVKQLNGFGHSYKIPGFKKSDFKESEHLLISKLKQNTNGLQIV